MDQVRGLLLNGGAAEDVVARELVLGLLQLAVADEIGLQSIQLLDERRFRLGRGAPRLDYRKRVEQVRIFDEQAVAGRGHRELLLVHQPAVDARALPVGQHLGRDVQRIRVGMPVVGDVMGHDDRGQGPVLGLGQGHPAFRGGGRLAGDVAGHRTLRLRHPAEVQLDVGEGLGGIEVADQDQGRVLGHVVGVEELPHVVDGGGLEILHAADDRVLVRVHRIGLVVHQLRQQAERAVLVAPAALFLDHLPLGLEGLLVDAERGHPIRLQPQDQRQILGGDRLQERGRVLGRIGVALAPHSGDEREMRVRGHVPGALEHHVLEQMGEPGAAGPFVLRPDVVDQLQVDDRRGMVLGEDHGQTVVQRMQLVVQLGRPDRALQGGGCDDQAGQHHE